LRSPSQSAAEGSTPEGEEVALRWLMAQGQACISVITWIEVLVVCRAEERERVETWLEGFRRWPVDDILAGLPLATRNTREFPLELGGVVHPYGL
jgi:hypothetical protein